MRVAVYNHFWATAGGAEGAALVLANALADYGPVDLWTPPGVDFGSLAERLQVDVSGLRTREVNFDTFADATALSAEYDLFVNATHATEVANAARAALLFLYFPLMPGRHLGKLEGRITDWLSKPQMLGYLQPLRWRRGVHALEAGPPPFRWTDGEGVLQAWVPPGHTRTLHLGIAFLRREPADVTILVDGAEVRRFAAGSEAPTLALPLRGRADGYPVDIRIRSGTFRPGAGDDRELGVPMLEPSLGRVHLPEAALQLRPVALARSFSWVDTYDRVIANSQYTRLWTRKLWHREADVLSPPVVLRAPGTKRNRILSVGRFFAPDRGHSKRQLDMVLAFGQLVEAGLTGWELHLVGGCEAEDLPYLRKVESAARHLPVVLHVDAPGAELESLYAEARVYWHMTGLHDDPEAHPERFEHFGIAVVEAMSAGAVPVVFGAAGPSETVRDGVDGLHFHAADELVERTLTIIGNGRLEDRLRASGFERAQRYSHDSFKDRVHDIVDDVMRRSTVSGPPPV